ncbi:MAG: ImmA/IrrE family metallo-endopeptidase [Nitrospirae bacterium]|nr:ImmA/IrrE family metallo-endopeptidase [Nitrospirota bacterium]
MRWRHPSVERLIEDGKALHGSEADPEEIIREKARGLVQYAMGLGWGGPPFDPVILAGLIGIKIVPVELPAAIDAMIVPSGDGRLKILLNSAVTQPERQNFSICHEIAHTFFPDCAEFIRMMEKGQGKADPDREVEALCNIAASELLLPGDHFLDSLKESGFSLSSVPPLSERFRASKSATVIKMVNTGIKVCAAVFLEPGRRKSINAGSHDNTLKMRVVYTVPSPGYRYFIPRNKSVPDDSCVYAAVGTNEVRCGREDWGIPGHPVYDVEAMYLPPLDDRDLTPRAVTLLRPALRGKRI